MPLTQVTGIEKLRWTCVYQDSVKRFRSNVTPLITFFLITVNNQSENYTRGQSEQLMIWHLFQSICMKYFTSIYLGSRPSTLGRGWKRKPAGDPTHQLLHCRGNSVHTPNSYTRLQITVLLSSGPTHLRKLPKGTVPALCHRSSTMPISRWTAACSHKVTLPLTSESRAVAPDLSVPFCGLTEGLIHVTAWASEHLLGVAAANHTAVHVSLSHFHSLDGTDWERCQPRGSRGSDT